ncbi:MAG: hypothetical protein GXP14_00960 [Gammaproteobacteria bacterium]|nr:hypothetical protein [Gammaproteobacteria bacterium]
MTDLIKRLFRVHVNSEDARVRAAIKRSGARVVGRGTVVIDPDKVRNSKKFRDNAKLAQNLVKKAS